MKNKVYKNRYLIWFIIGFLSIFLPLIILEIILIIKSIIRFGESFYIYKSTIDILVFSLLGGLASILPAYYYKRNPKLSKIILIIYLIPYLIFLIYILGFIYVSFQFKLVFG